MEYKDLLPIVMGVQNRYAEEANNDMPEFVTDFLEGISYIVHKNKEHIREIYSVDIERADYDIPYNYLIGKLSRREGDVQSEDLTTILNQLEIKVQVDLLNITLDRLEHNAIHHGDPDIKL